MDDIVNSVPSWMFTAIIAVCILFIIGIIFARLYRRASAEQAFVRTGLGGQKVVMSGGAIVMPIFHEIIPINMNTLKLEVSRSTIDSLITKDRMRVDVVVAFFVRVKPSVEGIATAAQTLGQRTLSPEDLRMLVEDKFVDALRATAAQMTMHELQDTRENFVQGVQNTVAEDLSKNGLELESVSLTNFNQTSKEHFNPNNAFDAEGLTKLTQETERRRRERNEVEQDVEVVMKVCVRANVERMKLDVVDGYCQVVFIPIQRVGVIIAVLQAVGNIGFVVLLFVSRCARAIVNGGVHLFFRIARSHSALFSHFHNVDLPACRPFFVVISHHPESRPQSAVSLGKLDTCFYLAILETLFPF